MTQRDDLDRMLAAWLDDPYTPPAPRYLGEVLERTRRTRQRPAWASLERWLPMAVITRPAPAPSAAAGLAPAHRPAGGGPRGQRRHRGLAARSHRPVRRWPPATATIPQGDEAVFAFGRPTATSSRVRADGTDLRQLTDGPGAA